MLSKTSKNAIEITTILAGIYTGLEVKNFIAMFRISMLYTAPEKPPEQSKNGLSVSVFHCLISFEV